MTPSKLNSLLQGQTNLARKVFEVVPIREAWPAIQIRNALKEVERSNADLRVVRGCLGPCAKPASCASRKRARSSAPTSEPQPLDPERKHPCPKQCPAPGPP